MIKFNPELLSKLQERYLEAIKDTYIQLDVARGIRSRPGSHKEHVFDFVDRVRLIISKEQEPDGRLVIHISGSISDAVPRQEAFHPIKLTDTYIHHIIEHYALVSGNTKELIVVGITEGNIIHFYSRLDN